MVEREREIRAFIPEEYWEVHADLGTARGANVRFEVAREKGEAFKPLNEVAPIGRKCIADGAQLLVPISEAQVREFALEEAQLSRRGEFCYFAEALVATRGTATRKLVCKESARVSRL